MAAARACIPVSWRGVYVRLSRERERGRERQRQRERERERIQ